MQYVIDVLDDIFMDDKKNDEEKVELLLKAMTRPEFLKPFVIMWWRVGIELFEQRFGRFALSKIFRGLWRVFIFIAMLLFAIALNYGWVRLPDVNISTIDGGVHDEQTK